MKKNLGISQLMLVVIIFQLVVEKEVFAQNSMAVIVHESVETNKLDKNEVLNIYLLRKQLWDSNKRIRIADYKGNSSIRIAFYNFFNTTPTNIKKIWLRAQFTGRSIPPIVVDSVDEMWKVVLENPGTIGYVPINQVPVNAKILLQIDG